MHTMVLSSLPISSCKKRGCPSPWVPTQRSSTVQSQIVVAIANTQGGAHAAQSQCQSHVVGGQPKPSSQSPDLTLHQRSAPNPQSLLGPLQRRAETPKLPKTMACMAAAAVTVQSPCMMASLRMTF